MTERGPVALLITGTGAHGDPWHGLEATSAAAAEVLAERFEVRRVTTDEPDALEGLAGAALVVLNVSGDLAEEPADSREIVDALVAANSAGTPILALHSSSLAFRADPRWAELLGGRWVPGTTMHPQIGAAIVQLPDTAPVADLAAFELYDERYTALERHDGTELIAFHTEDGMTHPLAWVRAARDGRAAAAYDALGHGVESYLSDGHRRLLSALVDLLTGRAGEAELAPAPATRIGAVRGHWDGLVVEAVGYELIALSTADADAAPSGFDDAFVAAAPVRRLVAGYLALEGDPHSSELRVVGHGVQTAGLTVDGDGMHVHLDERPQLEGRVLRAPEAGLAFVAERGEWQLDPSGAATLRGDAWRAAIVHGPASAKVENRIRLLDDVRRLTGTRGEHHG